MDMEKPSMFYSANAVIFKNAKKLRSEMTSSEIKLWERLSKNQLGVRFRAQHPVSDFVVDFYCHKARLIIEVDGDIHFNEKNIQEDMLREKEIESLGLLVIRFTNEHLQKDIENVVSMIKQTLAERLSQSSL
jgi:cyclase